MVFSLASPCPPLTHYYSNGVPFRSELCIHHLAVLLSNLKWNCLTSKVGLSKFKWNIKSHQHIHTSDLVRHSHPPPPSERLAMPYYYDYLHFWLN